MSVAPAPEAFVGELTVVCRREVADGVVTVSFARDGDQDLPTIEPGDHVELTLGPSLVRQYSLCGDVADRKRWTIAVLLDADGRGGSRAVHQDLHIGRRVTVDGPRRQFELAPAPHVLFVAGGIGITPLVPMIDRVAASGDSWRLLYGGRTRASMAFADALARHGEPVRIHPQDEHGLLPLAEELDRCVPGTLVYCCGPAPLIDAVALECAARGLSLRCERFEAAALTGTDAAFEVELARSGLVLEVPSDRTILEVVEDAGVDVLSSCRAGTCGTCEVGVLAGTPVHHDSFLTDDERASGEILLMCTARSSSPRLVLDC